MRERGQKLLVIQNFTFREDRVEYNWKAIFDDRH